MVKQPSIGPFIKRYLTAEIRKGDTIRQRRTAYGYELWKAYTAERERGHKSITYESFLRYLYIMVRLKLIKRTPVIVRRGGETKAVLGAAPEDFPGKKTTASLISKNLSKNPEHKIPKNWYRQYYTIVKENIDNPAWDNPSYYYKQLLYANRIYGTLKGKPSKKKYEKEIRESFVKKETAVPSVGNVTTIKVSKQVHDYIKSQMVKGESFNSTLARLLGLTEEE